MVAMSLVYHKLLFLSAMLATLLAFGVLPQTLHSRSSARTLASARSCKTPSLFSSIRLWHNFLSLLYLEILKFVLKTGLSASLHRRLRSSSRIPALPHSSQSLFSIGSRFATFAGITVRCLSGVRYPFLRQQPQNKLFSTKTEGQRNVFPPMLS